MCARFSADVIRALRTCGFDGTPQSPKYWSQAYPTVWDDCAPSVTAASPPPPSMEGLLQ